MGKTAEERLKPCPFCGPVDHEILKPQLLPWEHGYLVRCRLCPASMKVQTKYKSQAVATWNNRDGKLD